MKRKVMTPEKQPDSMTAEQAFDAVKGAKILFGLEAQGHIQTIESMLDKNTSWESIAEKIGWTPRAACEHYVRFLRKKIAVMEND